MAFTTSNGSTRSSLAEINITPLVDVVLVLLVIFMITAPVLQSGIEVDVPKTRTVKEITEQRLVLTIDRDQQVFLGDKAVNMHELPQQLRQSIDGPDKEGDLSARRRASAVRGVRVADGCGEAGGDHEHLDCDAAAEHQGPGGTVMEVSGHLEQELTPEPIKGPATGSVLLHLGLVGGIVLYGIIGGFFHRESVGRCGRRRRRAGEPGEQFPAPAFRPAAESECAVDRDAEPGAHSADAQDTAED